MAILGLPAAERMHLRLHIDIDAYTYFQCPPLGYQRH